MLLVVVAVVLGGGGSYRGDIGNNIGIRYSFLLKSNRRGRSISKLNPAMTPPINLWPRKETKEKARPPSRSESASNCEETRKLRCRELMASYQGNATTV